MFEAVISKGKIESVIEPVSALVGECKLQLDSDGMAVAAVDPANVGMVDVHLDAAAFESYETDGGVIGVNMDRFEDVVGMADAGHLIRLELDEEARKLHISLDGLEYTLALIDPDSIRQEPDLPDLELPAEIGFEGRDLDRAIKAAGMVGDQLLLGVDEDADVFYANAEGDTDQVYIEHARDYLGVLTAAEVRALFSLNYLKDMNNAIPKDAEITVKLGEELPVRIAFDFAEGGGNCQFVLSPRLEADE